MTADTPAMLQEDGFWVHHGVAPEEFDWLDFVEQQREERHLQVAGL